VDRRWELVWPSQNDGVLYAFGDPVAGPRLTFDRDHHAYRSDVVETVGVVDHLPNCGVHLPHLIRCGQRLDLSNPHGVWCLPGDVELRFLWLRTSGIEARDLDCRGEFVLGSGVSGETSIAEVRIAAPAFGCGVQLGMLVGGFVSPTQTFLCDADAVVLVDCANGAVAANVIRPHGVALVAEMIG